MNSGDWNGLRYGLASMQGWRIEMEVGQEYFCNHDEYKVLKLK